jgi:hypothetical protein
LLGNLTANETKGARVFPIEATASEPINGRIPISDF